MTNRERPRDVALTKQKRTTLAAHVCRHRMVPPQADRSSVKVEVSVTGLTRGCAGGAQVACLTCRTSSLSQQFRYGVIKDAAPAPSIEVAVSSRLTTHRVTDTLLYPLLLSCGDGRGTIHDQYGQNRRHRRTTLHEGSDAFLLPAASRDLNTKPPRPRKERINTGRSSSQPIAGSCLRAVLLLHACHRQRWPLAGTHLE